MAQLPVQVIPSRQVTNVHGLLRLARSVALSAGVGAGPSATALSAMAAGNRIAGTADDGDGDGDLDLAYAFSFTLRIAVDGEMEFVQGLTLKQVVLLLDVNKSQNSQQTFAFGIEATLAVAGTTLIVSGVVPDAFATNPELTLTLTLLDTLHTMDVDALLVALDPALSFQEAIGGTTSALQSEFAQGAASKGVDSRGVVSASMVLSGFAADSETIFVKSLSVLVRAGFDWALFDELTLRRVACTARMSRPNAETGTPWTYRLEAAGRFDLGVRGGGNPIGGTPGGSVLVATAVFEAAASSSLVVRFQVTPQARIGAAAVLDTFAAGSSASAKAELANVLPAQLAYLAATTASQSLDVDAELRLDNTSGSWTLRSVALGVACPGAVWLSPASDKFPQVRLSDLVVAFQANQTTGPAPTWQGRALVKASIGLRGGAIVLPTSLWSNAKNVVVSVQTAPGLAVGLTDLAGDNAFAPYGVTPPNLVASAAKSPLPDAAAATCPVDLTRVGTALGRASAALRLVFSGTSLVRLTLSAGCPDMPAGWQVTPALKVESLGVAFDLLNPCDEVEEKRVVKGYVFGALRLAGVAVTLFVAGTSSGAGATLFWASITAHAGGTDLDPRASLEMAAQDALGDAQLLGIKPSLVGWNLPANPPVSAEAALTEAAASLNIAFGKPTGSNAYVLLAAEARLDAQIGWTIYDKLVLAQCHLTLRWDGVGSAGEAHLVGTVAMDPYRVGVEMVCLRSRQASDTLYWAELSVDVVGSSGTLTQASGALVAAMPSFGGLSLDTTSLAKQIPTSFPVQPTSFATNDSALQLHASIQVKQPATGKDRSLTALRLELVQVASTSWSITTTVSLGSLGLRLTIADPFGTPQYVLVGEGVLTIGSVLVPAYICLVTASGKEQGYMTVAVGVGNWAAGSPYANVSALQVLAALVPDAASRVVRPPEFPIDPTAATTTATIVAKFAPSKSSVTGWSLQSVDMTANVAGATWSVGPKGHALLLSSLSLRARVTDVGQPTQAIAVTVAGTMSITTGDQKQATLSVLGIYKEKLALQLRFVAGTLDTAAMATMLYGAGWESKPSVPKLATGTVLDSYQSSVAAYADLDFVHTDGAWQPDRLEVGIQSGTAVAWNLVDGHLQLRDVGFAVVLAHLSSSTGFDVFGKLYGTLAYTGMADETPLQQSIYMELKAVATLLVLDIQMRDRPCTLPAAVFVATSGRIVVPGAFWPGVTELQMSMDWSAGDGRAAGVLNDIDLPWLGAIVKLLQPTLALQVARSSMAARGKFGATGQVSATIELLSKLKVPVSYDLPNGPLRIFGIPVKEIYDTIKDIYDMVKALWEFLRDLEGAVAAVTDICIALLALAGEVGALVGGALSLLGIVGVDIWAIVARYFANSRGSHRGGDSGGGSGHSGSNLDPGGGGSGGSGGTPGFGTWVVGGSGAVAGMPLKPVTLLVYPKDSGGNAQLIDATRLTATVSVGGAAVATVQQWVYQGPACYMCRYKRPDNTSSDDAGTPYTVTLTYASAAVGTLHLAATVADNTMSRHSLLDVPGSATSNVSNTFLVWPVDVAGRALTGLDWTDSFTVTITAPDNSVVQPQLAVYNDGLRVTWVPAAGVASYSIAVLLANQDPLAHVANSPATVVCAPGPDATRSFAYGPGLCTGLPGINDAFTVAVNDTTGSALTLGSQGINVSCLKGSTSAPTISSVEWSAAGLYTVSYTRPSTLGTWYFLVDISGVRITGSPFAVMTSTTPVALALEKTAVSLPSPPIVPGPIVASLIACDNLGYRWRKQGIAAQVSATVTTPEGNHTRVTLTDNSDGSASFTYAAASPGVYSLAVTAPSITGSLDTPNRTALALRDAASVTFTVVNPPSPSTFRCFGPLLEMMQSPVEVDAKLYYHIDLLAFDATGAVFPTVAGPDTFHVAAYSSYTGIGNPTIKMTQRGSGVRLLVTPNDDFLDPGPPDDGDDDGDDNGGLVQTKPGILRLVKTATTGGGSELRGSPWLVPTYGPTTSVLATFPGGFAPGAPCTVVLTACGRDTAKNPAPRRAGGDVVVVTAEPAAAAVVLTVLDNQDGTYTATFVTPPPPPTGALAFQLHVAVNPESANPVQGGPFAIPAAAAAAPVFVPTGAGLTAAACQQPASFHVSIGNGGQFMVVSPIWFSTLVFPVQATATTASLLVSTACDPAANPNLDVTYTPTAEMHKGQYKLRLLANFVAIEEYDLVIS